MPRIGEVRDEPQNEHLLSQFSECGKCDVDAHVRARRPATLDEHVFMYSIFMPRGWSDRYRCKHCKCGAAHVPTVVKVPEGMSPDDAVRFIAERDGATAEF